MLDFSTIPPWALAAGGVGAAWWGYGSAYATVAHWRAPPLGKRLRAGRFHLHVIERGAGESVLCLHGASANAREWLPLAGLLEGEFRVLAMDRPGHGHSRSVGDRTRLKVQAEAAAAALEALEAGPAIVVAHSLGCATALRLALDRPDLVRGLVLAAPATHPYPGRNSWHVRVAADPLIGPLFSRLVAPLAGPIVAGGAVRNTFAPAAPPAGYAREAGVALAFRPSAFRGNAREVAAAKREFEAQYFLYDDIEAPTIVVSTDRDNVLSPKIHARQLKRAIASAELVVAPGAGHMPHRLRPEALAASVRRIASTLAPARDAD